MPKIIASKGWTLFHRDVDRPVEVGEEITDFRGDIDTVAGGEPPHKSDSTGRVFVEHRGVAYFPSVFNLEWRKDS